MRKYNPVKYFTFIILMLTIFSCGCVKEKSIHTTQIKDSICNVVVDSTMPPVKAKKIIVVIMDGARFSETFGDTQFTYIPKLKQLAARGTVFTQFYNNGVTNTINGCSACISGNYSDMVNNGTASPVFPNMLNYYLRCEAPTESKACIISSKDKIAALAHTTNTTMLLPEPHTDCGVSGNGSGYRHDTVTFQRAKAYLSSQEPDVAFITFREPDYSGHTGIWQNYLDGVKLTDSLIFELYNYIQTISAYANNTDIFVTNDHGRHLDGVADGFQSHGDGCLGCRHIMLVAIGPDIKKNHVIHTPYELIDISKTVSAMLQINMPYNQGKIIKEMLE